jgi:GrpB-like predicted nucleotidyltransferase (UPF0157 family)
VEALYIAGGSACATAAADVTSKASGGEMSESIQIESYNPEWPSAFSAERDRLAAVLGVLAVRIDHHGSTSVPGLAAKPIIDIQVSVHQLAPIAAYGGALATLGYVHVPHSDDDFCVFFHRPLAWPHTHHVHVVQSGGNEERRTLAFRDYLRQHPEAARAYEDLKRGLAPHYCAIDSSALQAYAEAKSAFVTEITGRALAEGYPFQLSAVHRGKEGYDD